MPNIINIILQWRIHSGQGSRVTTLSEFFFFFYCQYENIGVDISAHIEVLQEKKIRVPTSARRKMCADNCPGSAIVTIVRIMAK